MIEIFSKGINFEKSLYGYTTDRKQSLFICYSPNTLIKNISTLKQSHLKGYPYHKTISWHKTPLDV